MTTRRSKAEEKVSGSLELLAEELRRGRLSPEEYDRRMASILSEGPQEVDRTRDAAWERSRRSPS